jgi:hypothetical protein
MHLPAGATIPGKVEQRIAVRLAMMLAVTALISVAPVIVGHANLLKSPPWALAAVSLASLQFFYAVWMINAPDWVSARVQMVACAAAATIYGMLMTVTMIAPNHGLMLVLGLGDVRHFAPAWCGLMLALMSAATWVCGRTSTKWKRSLAGK